MLPKELQEMLALEDLNYTEKSLKKSYQSFYNCYLKRGMDFILAIFGLVVMWPVVLIIMIAITLESGFPVFYTPLRGGYRSKPFRIFKFRTMIQNADKIGGGTTALNDSRITKIGKFLRKTKLDEITQLFNILNGTMSFIGPRPELLQYTNAYTGLDKHILDVRPGITDYSSIKFINLDEIVGSQNADEMYEKYVLKRKNQLRLKYVANVSLITDIGIFFTTVFQVFNKGYNVLKGCR